MSAQRDADVELEGRGLPCPFCGQGKQLELIEGLDKDEDDASDIGVAYFYVSCDDCGATGPALASEEKAIAGWNFRGGYAKLKP